MNMSVGRKEGPVEGGRELGEKLVREEWNGLIVERKAYLLS